MAIRMMRVYPGRELLLSLNGLGEFGYNEPICKASNMGRFDKFGRSVAISGDRIVVGAYREQSDASGVNGDQNNDNANGAGAAYVFVRTAGVWSQEAYLKSAAPDFSDQFGIKVAISGDRVAVSAPYEDSDAIGVDGDPFDNSAAYRGAVFVLERDNGLWRQDAYLKPSSREGIQHFGGYLAMAGSCLVAATQFEDSGDTGINGNQADTSEVVSGAAYLFEDLGNAWVQSAYVKASNTDTLDV
jgi:hypothetical protein